MSELNLKEGLKKVERLSLDKRRIDRLDLKLNLLILLVVIVLTVMNPVVAELLKKWFGIH
jgi:hypothetical protein